MRGITSASFIGIADLRDHLRRAGRQEDGFDERAAAAINAAAATLRAETGRILRSTTYRTAVSVADLSAQIDTDTGIATLSREQGMFAGDLVIVDDEVVSNTLDVESRVVAVTQSEVQIYPCHDENPAPAGLYTFGSDPMVLSGDGTGEILADEWPVSAWRSAAYWSGTEWVDLDLTGARFGSRSLRLAFGVFPEGERNVRVEVTAGFREPRPGVRGDPVEWADLRRVSLRLAEMHFNEDASLRGRARTLAGPGGAVATESMWPTDVASVLYSPKYRRYA